MDGLNHSLWVEKYRPNKLENYIGNEHLKSKVKRYIDDQDIPHLLLYGRAGTGKTTLAKLIIKNVECDYLYINASDENSVDAVRFKIRAFASTVGFKDMKVVILDECDYLTPNAQAALRNVMETFSKHCRFILTCNYVERVIDPIQSRCQSYKIVPPKKSDVARHMVNILDTEKVKYDLDDVELYRLLYDEIDNYSNGRVAECILAIAEGQYQDVNVVDKEINFMSTIMKIQEKIRC